MNDRRPLDPRNAGDAILRRKLVLVESPYAGEVEMNVAYARAAMCDCLGRGEAPYASHLLLTQPGILDDADPDERQLGIDVGLLWGAKADLSAFYVDLGESRGMQFGLMNAIKAGRPHEQRSLPDMVLGRVLHRYWKRLGEAWPTETQARVREYVKTYCE